MAPLRNSGIVPVTGSIRLPRYAAFVHYIKHLLKHDVDMPYNYYNWGLKYLNK